MHLLALVSGDPTTLQPDGELELAEWRGHFKGLRSALHCMLMHEKAMAPESAALVVEEHLARALTDLDTSADPDVGR